MRSVAKEKTPFFTCDDLPMPVIIHRLDNGLVLKFNPTAKKLFGLGARPVNINKLRPSGLPVRIARSTGFTDLGPVAHRTLKGKCLNLTVMRKRMVWNKM